MESAGATARRPPGLRRPSRHAREGMPRAHHGAARPRAADRGENGSTRSFKRRIESPRTARRQAPRRPPAACSADPRARADPARGVRVRPRRARPTGPRARRWWRARENAVRVATPRPRAAKTHQQHGLARVAQERAKLHGGLDQAWNVSAQGVLRGSGHRGWFRRRSAGGPLRRPRGGGAQHGAQGRAHPLRGARTPSAPARR